MEYRTVGRSGLVTSVTGLGCNNLGARLDPETSLQVVRAALDSGCTMFDTSNSYGTGRSEELLGEGVRGHRDEVIIATKFGSSMGEGPYDRGASRRHILAACEASLRRLGTDYIDLYYLHFPDVDTPIDETLDALNWLIDAGKVRYIAASNLAGWQIADAEHTARQCGRNRFVAVQFEWNLVSREAEKDIVPAGRHFGIGLVPYFPLAAGLLTGKYRAGQDFPPDSRLAKYPFFAQLATKDRLAKIEALRDYAAQHGRTLVGLAVSWLAAQPGVACVLAGASSAEQARANGGATTAWSMTPAELEEIDQL
jgi:aryl-alcohol dehydrogenase-like predicted oxidoreductase